MPNGDEIEPLAGQMRPPEPCRIGPATADDPASWAVTSDCSRSSAATCSSSACRSARVLASSCDLPARADAQLSRRSTSWPLTAATSATSASITFATSSARFSSRSRRSAVAIDSTFASRTREMIRASCAEARFMNSVCSSRSAKPSASSTTVTTSGVSCL